MTNAIKLIQSIEEDGFNVTAEHLEALDLAIKALEERPQGKWIPVSERLPSDDEPYEVLCCDNHGEIMIGHPFSDEESECGYSAENEGCFMYECIAWQPLPKPYEKGGAE